MTNNSINIVNQVSVDSNMKVKVFLKGNKLAYNDLKWILPFEMKLSRWSQLENLLSRYQFIHCESNESATQKVLDFLKTSVNFLNKALSLLNFETSEDDSQSHNLNAEDNNLYNRILLLIDQINLLVIKQKHYLPSTIVMSFMLYTLSPCAYDLMRDYLNLPTKRYLQYLSSSLDVSPNTSPNTTDNDKTTTNYLNIVSSSLTSNEKIVNLLIDEVYVSKRLDYRGKNLIGVASNHNSLATTVLAFMICSSFGNFSEIVKLLPVKNIKGT